MNVGTEVYQPFAPFGDAGDSVSVVVGATASRAIRVVASGPTFPAWSTDRYATWCSPCVARVIGPVYACSAPPSTRNAVDATPDPGAGSEADSVNATLDRRNQPSAPSGVAGVVASVVVGPIVSIAKTVVEVALGAESLPTVSLDWTRIVYLPSCGSCSGRLQLVVGAPGTRSAASRKNSLKPPKPAPVQ